MAENKSLTLIDDPWPTAVVNVVIPNPISEREVGVRHQLFNQGKKFLTVKILHIRNVKKI